MIIATPLGKSSNGDTSFSHHLGIGFVFVAHKVTPIRTYIPKRAWLGRVIVESAGQTCGMGL